MKKDSASTLCKLLCP